MCKCNDCGNAIHPARLELLPDTQHCVKCSDKHTFKYHARIIYSHKADCEMFIARTPQGAQRLEREYCRGR
jgi:hypothetical protein